LSQGGASEEARLYVVVQLRFGEKTARTVRENWAEDRRNVLGQWFHKDRRVENYYELGATLGSGSFGEVRLATRKADGVVVAVKIVKKKTEQDEAKASKREHDAALMASECSVLKAVVHPNIIQVQSRLRPRFRNNTNCYSPTVGSVCLDGDLN
jgi:serine/threonine protein kinase